MKRIQAIKLRAQLGTPDECLNHYKADVLALLALVDAVSKVPAWEQSEATRDAIAMLTRDEDSPNGGGQRPPAAQPKEQHDTNSQ